MRKMMITILAGLGIMTMSMSSAMAAAQDDYKFMATVAAVAEMCYDSEEIPDTLNVVLSAGMEENPQLVPLYEQLMDIYNTAYYAAIVDAKIWIGSQQRFSPTLTCSDKNVAKIKKMEVAILDNLNS